MIKIVVYGIQYIISNIKITLLILCGKNIKHSLTTKIDAHTRFKTCNKGKIELGKKTSICSNVELSANGGFIKLVGENYINRNTMIQSHSYIYIGKGTTIGPNVLIYDHDHDITGESKDGFISKEIVIGSNVWIGGGSIILKGVHIGDNSVIAAGSIVSKDIECNTILYQKRMNTIRKKIMNYGTKKNY